MDAYEYEIKKLVARFAADVMFKFMDYSDAEQKAFNKGMQAMADYTVEHIKILEEYSKIERKDTAGSSMMNVDFAEVMKSMSKDEFDQFMNDQLDQEN